MLSDVILVFGLGAAIHAAYLLWSALRWLLAGRQLPLPGVDWGWWVFLACSGGIAWLMSAYCTRFGSSSGSCWMWTSVIPLLALFAHAALLHIALAIRSFAWQVGLLGVAAVLLVPYVWFVIPWLLQSLLVIYRSL